MLKNYYKLPILPRSETLRDRHLSSYGFGGSSTSSSSGSWLDKYFVYDSTAHTLTLIQPESGVTEITFGNEGGDIIAYSDFDGNPPSIWDGLPIASETTLGAIKVGDNLTIESDGTLNATASGGGGETGATNLNTVYHEFTVDITSDTGDDAVISGATTTKAGVFIAADKVKLNGIEDGAEVNVQSDWNETNTTSDAFIKNVPTTFPPSPHDHDDRYVNITGDTMTGNLTICNTNPTINLNDSCDTGIDVSISVDGENFYIKEPEDSNKEWFRITDDDNAYVFNNKVWTAGNDGDGSGLDSDYLDGRDSSEYAIKVSAETITGIWNFNGGSWDSTPPFNVDSNYLVTNLNADMVDGIHAEDLLPYISDDIVKSTSTNNEVILFQMEFTPARGDVAEEIFVESRWGSISVKFHVHNGLLVVSADYLYEDAAYKPEIYAFRYYDSVGKLFTYEVKYHSPSNTADDTVRYKVIAHGGNIHLSDITRGTAFVGSQDNNVTVAKTWNSENDGAGSGLDADYLDGYDSTCFPRKAEDATITGNWNIANYMYFNDDVGTKASIYKGGDDILRIGARGEDYCKGFQITSSGNVSLNQEPTNNYLMEINGTVYFGGITTHGNGLTSPVFTSGFAGSGWKIDRTNNKAEFDYLTVRKSMRVYELEIDKIRSGNGSYWFSDGIKATYSGHDPFGQVLTFTIDDENGTILIPFEVNDIVRVQMWTGHEILFYEGKINTVNNAAGNSYFKINEGDSVNWDDLDLNTEYEFVRIGNSSNTDRQGAVYITSNDSNSPYMDVVEGYSSVNGSFTTKARLGKLDGITDVDAGLDGQQTNYYGLYTDNGHFKGHIHSTSGTIGGNEIDEHGIRTSNHTVHMYNDSSRLAVTKAATLTPTSGARVQMYYNSCTDWGLYGSSDGTNVEFQLGSCNQIAGWGINSSCIYNTNVVINSAGSINVYCDANNYVCQYYSSDADWGIKGVCDSNAVFKLGKTNAIAGWSFDNNQIYNDHVQIQSSGRIKVEYGTGNCVEQFFVDCNNWGIQGWTCGYNTFKLGNCNCIAGWDFTSSQICSSNGKVVLDSSGSIKVSEDSNNYVRQYYTSPTDWGIIGRSGGITKFKLGNCNCIAGWDFDGGKIYNGHVELNSTGCLNVCYDSNNYVKQYYTSTTDWGIKGVSSGDTIFQLGNTNKIAGFSFTNDGLLDSTQRVAMLDNDGFYVSDTDIDPTQGGWNNDCMVGMYYSGDNDWGLVGMDSNSIVFQLGSDNCLGGFCFNDNCLFSDYIKIQKSNICMTNITDESDNGALRFYNRSTSSSSAYQSGYICSSGTNLKIYADNNLYITTPGNLGIDSINNFCITSDAVSSGNLTYHNYFKYKDGTTVYNHTDECYTAGSYYSQKTTKLYDRQNTTDRSVLDLYSYNNAYVGLAGLHSTSYNTYAWGTMKVTGAFYAQSVTETSDINLKNNIKDLRSEIDLSPIDDIKFVEFNFLNDDSNKKYYGISAQDIQDKFPDVVNTVYEDIYDDDNNLIETKETLGVNYTSLFSIKIARLEERIEQLENIIENFNTNK